MIYLDNHDLPRQVSCWDVYPSCLDHARAILRMNASNEFTLINFGMERRYNLEPPGWSSDPILSNLLQTCIYMPNSDSPVSLLVYLVHRKINHFRNKLLLRSSSA